MRIEEIKRIKKESKKQFKKLKEKVKKEKKGVKTLGTTLDQILKKQDLETELKDIEKESASISSQLPSPQTAPKRIVQYTASQSEVSSTTKESEEQIGKMCNFCGGKLDPNFAFCPQCGVDQKEEA